MKNLILLFVMFIGINLTASAQMQFTVDIDGKTQTFESKGNYNSQEVQSLLKANNYNGPKAKVIPVYVWEWDGKGWNYLGKFDFYIDPNETMDSVINRLIAIFF